MKRVAENVILIMSGEMGRGFAQVLRSDFVFDSYLRVDHIEAAMEEGFRSEFVGNIT